METTAEETDGGYVIAGTKTYISNGGIADYYVLFARTGEAPGAKGISAFIVDADTPGLDVSERIRVIAPHPLATLRFDGMKLPAGTLLGERGRGFAQAMATLDVRSEEHTSALPSLMRISYAVFCFTNKNTEQLTR